MTVETLQDAEMLAEHVNKQGTQKLIGSNPFVQAMVLLYNEIRRIRNGSATESNGDHRA